MYINDRGQTVLQSAEEIHAFKIKMSRLRENRKLHGRTTFQSLPISIENRKGSVRKGTDDDGEEWRTKMKVPYGYIPGTEGVDGDALDVFVGPDEDAAFAYIVHCNTPDGTKFDEDKVMLGFSSSKSAKQCFLQHYDDNKFFGGIDSIPMWKFRERAFVKKHTTKKLVASMRESVEGGPGSGPHRSGGYVTFYHGTRPSKIGKIKKFGLQPGHTPRGGKATRGKVYLSSTFNNAKEWGNAVITPSYRERPAILKVRLPEKFASKINQDTRDLAGTTKNDYTFRGSIPSKYISIEDPGKKPGEKDIYGQKIPKRYREGASLQLPSEILTGKPSVDDVLGRGTDQDMKRDILGRNLMPAPGVRESVEGGPGSGPHPTVNWKRDTGKFIDIDAPFKSHGEPWEYKGKKGKYMEIPVSKIIPDPNNSRLNGKIIKTYVKKMKDGKTIAAPRALQNDDGTYLLDEGHHRFAAAKRLGEKSIMATVIPRIRPNFSKESFSNRIGGFLREAKKIYFARPMSHYGTDAEESSLDAIREAFPNDSISFPKTKRHAELGMGYFHKQIDAAKRLVIKPIRKKRLTAGVFSEAVHALKKKIPVYALHKGRLRKVKKVEALRHPNNEGHFGRIIFKKKRRA